jgi:pimeloyl-ACP methyl ester carboxylesterase
MSLPMRILWLAKRAGLVRKAHPQPGYAWERQRQASASYDATARLGGIRAPALVLHGRKDRSMPLAAAERMHAGIAGSRLEVFRGGHLFFVFTERQRLLAEVTGFLAASPPGS